MRVPSRLTPSAGSAALFEIPRPRDRVCEELHRAMSRCFQKVTANGAFAFEQGKPLEGHPTGRPHCQTVFRAVDEFQDPQDPKTPARK
jgi:hypothetical protein